jgi:hypothetical protein
MLQGIQRQALRRALRGQGSRAWLVVGTAAWLLRTANRLRKPQPEIVYRSVLDPGEQLVIDHLAVDQAGKPTRVRRTRRR